MTNDPKKPKISKNPAAPQLQGDGPTPGNTFCWPGGCTVPPPGDDEFNTLVADGWTPPGSVLVHVVHEGGVATYGWPGGGKPPPGMHSIVVFGWPGGGKPPPQGTQDAVTAGWPGGCTKPPPNTPKYAELLEKGWIPPGVVITRVVHPDGVKTLGWPGGGKPPPPPQGLHHMIAFGWPGGGIPPPEAPHHVVTFGWPGGGTPPPGVYHIPAKLTWPGGNKPPP
jgi:hypothetical protein